MFHLETGGGIKKYRKYLLNQLIDLGLEGERAWREIISKVKLYEHHPRKGTKSGRRERYRYPRTLEEALKIYG